MQENELMILKSDGSYFCWCVCIVSLYFITFRGMKTEYYFYLK